MTKCYLCGRSVKVPKHTTPNKKYICRRCYFKDMLRKKLKFWKR